MPASFPTSIKSFAANQDDVTVVNAALIDAIHDEIEAIETGLITWTAWTPTVTQSGSVTVTVTRARYIVAGKIAHVQANLLVTGSGTITNAIVIGGQPAAIQSPANLIIGGGLIIDTGTQIYGGLSLVAVGATDWRFYGYAAGTSHAGVTPNFALANTDVIQFQAVYEVG